MVVVAIKQRSATTVTLARVRIGNIVDSSGTSRCSGCNSSKVIHGGTSVCMRAQACERERERETDERPGRARARGTGSAFSFGCVEEERRLSRGGLYVLRQPA